MESSDEEPSSSGQVDGLYSATTESSSEASEEAVDKAVMDQPSTCPLEKRPNSLALESKQARKEYGRAKWHGTGLIALHLAIDPPSSLLYHLGHTNANAAMTIIACLLTLLSFLGEAWLYRKLGPLVDGHGEFLQKKGMVTGFIVVVGALMGGDLVSRMALAPWYLHILTLFTLAAFFVRLHLLESDSI